MTKKPIVVLPGVQMFSTETVEPAFLKSVKHHLKGFWDHKEEDLLIWRSKIWTSSLLNNRHCLSPGDYTNPTVKHGGGNIMQLGCFLAAKTKKLVSWVDMQIIVPKYREIHKENLFQSAYKLKLAHLLAWQQPEANSQNNAKVPSGQIPHCPLVSQAKSTEQHS